MAVARCQLPSVTAPALVTSDGTWCAERAQRATMPQTSFPDPSTHRSRSLSGDPLSNCELERLKMVPLAPGAALNQADNVKLPGVEYAAVDSNQPVAPSRAIPVPPIGPSCP